METMKLIIIWIVSILFYKFYVDWYLVEDLEDNDILLPSFTSEPVIDNNDIFCTEQKWGKKFYLKSYPNFRHDKSDQYVCHIREYYR